MPQTAKLFTNGRSQAVRLPAAYRFEGSEVFIRRDPESGDVILSAKPDSWDGFLRALAQTDIPANFLSPSERVSSRDDRDALQGWQE